MEQDSRVRPMSREENAAYRGVTLEESGAEPRADEGQTQYGGAYGDGAYGSAPRGSVRYIRIGGARRPSLLTSFVWSLAAAAFLVLFFFVALPAIVILMACALVIALIVSLIGRDRIIAWIMRHVYGR